MHLPARHLLMWKPSPRYCCKINGLKNKNTNTKVFTQNDMEQKRGEQKKKTHTNIEKKKNKYSIKSNKNNNYEMKCEFLAACIIL